MKALALATLGVLFAALPLRADEPKTEVTLLFGVSFLDARVDDESAFPLDSFLPPGFPSGLLPPIRIQERRSLGGSIVQGFAVSRRVAGRAWLEGEFLIAPAHHLDHEVSLDCPAEVCALLGSAVTNLVRPLSARENVVAYHYGLGLSYELTKGEVRPFLSLGAGGVSYDTAGPTETDFAFQVGVGARLSLGERIAARLEVVDRVVPDHFMTGRTEHDVHLRAGFSFRP